MKHNVVLTTMMVFLGLILGSQAANFILGSAGGQGQKGQGRKPPDVLQLAKDSKLGTVTFSHTNHTTKNYNITGTGPVACIECHHTAQPASEVAKHPPLRTAWPADRTTTLTAENVSDPKTPEVIGCRSCHARADAKPKVLPEIPQIKYEGGTALITLTNQQAFHRNCASCHDLVAKERNVKAPKTQQCTACHKRTAA
jgi:hypothetical protein